MILKKICMNCAKVILPKAHYVGKVWYYQSQTDALRRNCASSQNWACFVHSVLKNNICILKWILWEIQKWHLNVSRPSDSWGTDQNNILPVLINNLRTTWPTEIVIYLSIYLFITFGLKQGKTQYWWTIN